jgi:photosystem II stability/assembly factor-like uncharacterized protein
MANVFWKGIACSDDTFVMAVGVERGSHSIARMSTDAGKTWTTAYYARVFDSEQGTIFPAKLTSVASGGTGEFFVATDMGALLITRNQGASWDSLLVSAQSYGHSKVVMATRTDGALSIDAHRIALTDDGWRTFRFSEIPRIDSQYVIGLSMPSPNVVYVTQGAYPNSSLCRSVDAGRTWTVLTLPPFHVHLGFVDADHGWAVGGFPTGAGDRARDLIAHTDDGGTTWSVDVDEEIFPAFGLLSVTARDRLTAIATGSVGKVLLTRDGGQSWIPEDTGLDPNTLPHVTGAAFVGENRVYAASRYGVIIGRSLGTADIPEPRGTSGHLVLWPQPANDFVTLDGIPSHANALLKIRNLIGQEVIRVVLENHEEHAAIITSQLANGVYMLSVGTQVILLRIQH